MFYKIYLYLSLARILARRDHWCGKQPEYQENPRVQAGDRHTLSHTTNVDHGVRTRVAAVRSECIVHLATRISLKTITYVKLIRIFMQKLLQQANTDTYFSILCRGILKMFELRFEKDLLTWLWVIFFKTDIWISRYRKETPTTSRVLPISATNSPLLIWLRASSREIWLGDTSNLT